jgi:hypothetical protein
MDNMAEDALRERYGRRHLIRFGRSGQYQGGIDGLDQQDPTLVWQTTLQAAKVFEKIQDDIATLDNDGEFHPEVFVAVLGVPRDANIQREIKRVSIERQINGKCRVELLFWEDVRQILIGNPVLLAKHFSGFGVDARASELTELEIERRQFARIPDLHLRWVLGGEVTGTESESRKLEILNVGGSTSQITSIYLEWRIAVGLASRRVTPGVANDILAPNKVASVTLKLLFRDVSEACAEAGLPRPKVIQEAPLIGKVVVTAVSRPYKLEKIFNIKYERIVSRPSTGISDPVAVRKKILDACYKLLMTDAPNGLVNWQFARDDDLAEMKAIYREAGWLRDHGLITATLAGDMTIVTARLTTAGRDYIEALEDAGG